MNIYDLPHTKAQALLKENNCPVFVYINPIEYHGPHLPLNTDALQSIALGKKLHQQLTQKYEEFPYLVAADIRLGVDPTPGAGTVTTSFKELKSCVLKVSRSLQKMGARKVIFLSHHGSPLHSLALFEGVKYLRKNGIQAISPFVKVINKMLNFDPILYYPLADKIGEPRSFIDELQYDFHAGCFETSVCLYLAPESVDPIFKELLDVSHAKKKTFLHSISKIAGRFHSKTASELDYISVALNWLKLNPFPGYTGKPSKASAEIGEYFVNKHILPLYRQEAIDVLWEEKEPESPMMVWITKVPFKEVL